MTLTFTSELFKCIMCTSPTAAQQSAPHLHTKEYKHHRFPELIALILNF